MSETESRDQGPPVPATGQHGAILSAAAVACLRLWPTQARREHLGGTIETLADSHDALKAECARLTTALAAAEAARDAAAQDAERLRLAAVMVVYWRTLSPTSFVGKYGDDPTEQYVLRAVCEALGGEYA